MKQPSEEPPDGPVPDGVVIVPPGADREETAALARRLVVNSPIVLVGLMGAGKTTIGRRLAQCLRLPFRDADEEIERAAGLRVTDIFEQHGEAEFRRGERGVIRRLLDDPKLVLATGGGAFIDPETRALIKERATSVWLRAGLDVLMRRVERRDDRPLLRTSDPRATMARLMAERYPLYAEADLVVDTDAGPQTLVLQKVLQALVNATPSTDPLP